MQNPMIEFVRLAFIGAGAAKLSSQAMMVAEFQTFGYSLWFMYLTGALEVVSGLLLFVPRYAGIGAALLACTMTCAQNEISRGVPVASSPMHDRKHWRSLPTSEISAMGAWQMCAANLVRSSNTESGWDPEMS